MSLNKPCLQSPACNILREVSGLTSSCSEFLSNSPLLAQEQGALLGHTFTAPIAARGAKQQGDLWDMETRAQRKILGNQRSGLKEPVGLFILPSVSPGEAAALCHLRHTNPCPASFIKSHKSPIFVKGALPGLGWDSAQASLLISMGLCLYPSCGDSGWLSWDMPSSPLAVCVCASFGSSRIRPAVNTVWRRQAPTASG